MPVIVTVILIARCHIECINSSYIGLSVSVPLYMTSHHSLRVFMPVQRARCCWATTSPLHSPPQQTAEDHPRIPAPTTAAYRLWAGEHIKLMQLVRFHLLRVLAQERHWLQSVGQNMALKHLCVQSAVYVFVIDISLILTRKHTAGLKNQQRLYRF